MQINEEEYFCQRLEEQIEWYNKRSEQNQKMYKRLRGAELILSGSIPFIISFSNTWSGAAIVVGFLGVVITAIGCIISLYKYHENWITYRNTCEALQREKYLYLTRTNPYTKENPFHLLVERVEALMANENHSWSQIQSKTHSKEQINC